ncbi:hypothetical protein NFI96_025877 [Prochilodus magdalenae]|nr:hypothetical protein NFI96_025877 [Prochilodus magdalenae]
METSQNRVGELASQGTGGRQRPLYSALLRENSLLCVRMKLLTLLLLLGFTSMAVSEVVQSFRSTCPQFFFPDVRSSKHEVTTPTVLKGAQYKQICQRLNDQYRYATLYDTKRRIPVYSAYTFIHAYNVPRTEDWKIEPQLDLPLTPEHSEMKKMNQSETSNFKNQARNEDYKRYTGPDHNITRGHVFPNSYAGDQDQADSTFTLTNAAPQTRESNNEWAVQVEKPMLNQIKNECTLTAQSPAYIVTGVVPGKMWLEIKIGNRNIKEGINIPSYYWAAFTCINNNRQISHAHLAQQIYRDGNSYTKFIKQKMTVEELDKKLSDLYKQPFGVFKRINS